MGRTAKKPKAEAAPATPAKQAGPKIRVTPPTYMAEIGEAIVPGPKGGNGRGE